MATRGRCPRCGGVIIYSDRGGKLNPNIKGVTRRIDTHSCKCDSLKTNKEKSK